MQIKEGRRAVSDQMSKQLLKVS